MDNLTTFTYMLLEGINMTKRKTFIKKYNKSFKSKIILLFTIFTLIPLGIVGGFSYYQTSVAIKKTITESVEQTTQYINSSIDNLFTTLLPILNITSDYRTHFFLNSQDEDSLYLASKNMGLIFSDVLRVNEFNDYIVDINIVGKSGNAYSERQGFYKLENKFMSYPIIENIKSNPRKIHILDTPSSLFDYEVSNNIISIATAVFKSSTNELQGILTISIDTCAIDAIVGNPQTNGKNAITILNSNGQVLINYNEQFDNILDDNFIKKIVNPNNQQGSFFTKSKIKKNQSYFVVHNTLNLTDWKIVSLIPEAEIMAPLLQIRNISLVTLIIAITLALTINVILSNSIVKPIVNLQHLMKQTEDGSFDIDIDYEGNDEIAQLYNSYKILLLKIKELLNSLVEQRVNLERSELKALQAQINPHFLYNTLDSVIWVAETNEMEQVIDLTLSLSKFYRIVLSKGYDSIPFELEIEHSQSYLKIMKMRYNDILDYEFKTDPNVLQCKFPKIIMQPIIENSIYHGLKNLNMPGKIIISSQITDDNMLYIEICDTGIGMDQNKINTLRSYIEDDTISSNESYGLKNVNQRLKLFFGKEYGLVIDSKINVGTVVKIKVPILE